MQRGEVVLVPPNSSTEPRYDLIVMRHQASADGPTPPATFSVIKGVEAKSGEPTNHYPELPSDALLLAYAKIEPGGVAWSQVVQAGPPERLVNCSRQADGSYLRDDPSLAALRLAFNPSPDNAPASLNRHHG